MKYFDIYKFNFNKLLKKHKMTYLKEKTINTKTVHEGNYLTLNRDEVLLPNGNKSTREWIKHPGAVCCIPILPDGKIGLIKQYRYAVKEQMIEIQEEYWPDAKRKFHPIDIEYLSCECRKYYSYKNKTKLFKGKNIFIPKF